MAVPFSNTKLRVPRGFQNLLEGLAREVLRSQPDDIYAFGAMYFENQVKSREESGEDPAEHGANMEDRFYNNKAFTQPDIDPSDPQQQDAALAIQTKYRQHAAKQEVEGIREEKAATKIQAGYRGYQGRMKVLKIKDPEEYEKQMKNRKGAGAEKAVQDEEEAEIDIDLNDPEVEQAAIKIQAGFKGFKARQQVQDVKEQKKIEGITKNDAETAEEIDIDLSDPDVEKAAVKIQAGFKGMKTRQEMQQRRNKDHSVANDEFDAHSQSDIDIDLNDPDVEKAATKIQAGFKGMKTRKEMKMKQSGKSSSAEAPETAAEEPGKADEEEVDIDLNDPEVEKAAVKIQAGFKGMKTRRDIQSRSAKRSEEATEEAAPIAEPQEESQQKHTTVEVTHEPLKSGVEEELVESVILEQDVAKADEQVEGNEQEPAVQSSEAPAAEQPSEAPATQQPSEAPAAEQPAETPAAEQPSEAPAAEQPSDAPAAEQPAEAPAAEKPAEAPAAEQTAEVPAAEKPSEAPAAEQSAEVPATEESAEASAAEQPSEAPATEQPSEAPAAEQSAEAPAEEKPTEAPAEES